MLPGLILHTLGHAATARFKREMRAATTRRRKLRIGVDIRSFYEPLTGVGWYLYFLLQELGRRDDVELVLFGDARITDEGPLLHAAVPANAEVLTFDLRGRTVTRIDRALTAGAYVIWLELSSCDVVFGANYFLPRLHSAVARRRVVTVHDLTYKRFPDLLQKETLHNLERHMAREIASADAIICVSESTRQDLLHYYTLDPRRAVTVHSGLGTTATPVRVPELPDRYILFVSTIEPRKNLAVLIEAYEEIRDRYDGQLVIVGKIGWKSEEILPLLRRPGIVHLDYLEPGRLATVYQNADVFVMPSLYEGFGFPLLEAMHRGVPTIAARSSSLPEIGGDASLYFDPESRAELVSLLLRVTGDPALREQLAAKGRVRAATFTWTKAADETLKVLRRAAGQG